VRGGSGQDFSNSCGRGASLNFEGAGQKRTKNFNQRRTLIGMFAEYGMLEKVCNVK